jgi:hypothetical protein
LYRNIDPAEQPKPQDDVIEWMTRLRATKAAYRESPGSYSMKHTAERLLGRYVSEDEVLAAARQLGYPIWMHPPHRGVTALIGVSRKDYDAEFRRAFR